MIHITKAKGGYMVINLGQKREVLATSEILKTKTNAIANAISQAHWFLSIPAPYNSVTNANGAIIQDDTGKEASVFYAYMKDGKIKRGKIAPEILKKYKIKKYQPK
jgi:hypothetical protein